MRGMAVKLTTKPVTECLGENMFEFITREEKKNANVVTQQDHRLIRSQFQKAQSNDGLSPIYQKLYQENTA